jgi:ribosomal protein S18 acetylase RimI-like enzyme
MEAADLAAVHALSLAVHPDHPERAEVLAEKFRLFPGGCFVLDGASGIAGYCFSHPWTRDSAPALDTLIGALPQRPGAYFIHDLTVDPAARGAGLGRAVVPHLFDVARSLKLTHLTLVAVNDRGPFWRAAGFSAVADEAMQAAARAKYGAGALMMAREL